jgi:hypothetical protein
VPGRSNGGDAVEGTIHAGDPADARTGQEVITAGEGLVWTPVVGGRLIRFVGADLLTADDARMEFRLHGLIPVVRADGLDVRRSAQGRLAAETAAWLPHALTPQMGARWTPVDDDRAIVTLSAAGATVTTAHPDRVDRGELRVRSRWPPPPHWPP